MPRARSLWIGSALIAILVAAIAVFIVLRDGPSTAHPGEGAVAAPQRDPDVPDLPFEDNPDPNQCGIPTQWGGDGQAWLTGIWDGQLIEPDVYLYDSHLRLSITGRAPHGSPVQVLLYQENPVLDYYFVKVSDTGVEGWVPEYFVSFDPVS